MPPPSLSRQVLLLIVTRVSVRFPPFERMAPPPPPNPVPLPAVNVRSETEKLSVVTVGAILRMREALLPLIVMAAGNAGPLMVRDSVTTNSLPDSVIMPVSPDWNWIVSAPATPAAQSALVAALLLAFSIASRNEHWP